MTPLLSPQDSLDRMPPPPVPATTRPNEHLGAVAPRPIAGSGRASARAADSESFREGLVEALPLLRGRALRLTRNPALAEDLVQDTLLRALRFEASFEPGTHQRAWLNQVLFSVFVSWCRRRRRERRALEVLATDPCAWPSPEPVPTMSSLTRRMEGAIQTLPKQFASVIRLVDLGEHSYKDAAEHLGVPVGTVMSRLFRGRRLLAAALDEEPARAA